jgi:hypothetical protein
VTAGEVNLGPARVGLDERTRARIEERDAYAAEVERAASGFPTYEVPAFVADRFPEFRPEDPETWPEPDRCTDGRPYGFSAYEYSGSAKGVEDRWRRYLAALDAGPRPAGARRSFVDRDKGCRNRWKHEDSRLCGTHDRPWRDAVFAARKRLARNARELEHLDLARQLSAYGIEADGFSDSVRLQADAVRALLVMLAPAEDRPPPVDPFPSTDLTIPPPL